MSEATDPVNVIYKIKRHMESNMESLIQTIANGGVDSMEAVSYTHLPLPTSDLV